MIVLDSNVVSYIFNGDGEAQYYEEQIRGHNLFISFVTLEESWKGAYSRGWGERRMRELESYLEQYEVVRPGLTLVDVCARLRSARQRAGRSLSFPDAWIAATALFLSRPLASHDRVFQGIPNLELIQAP